MDVIDYCGAPRISAEDKPKPCDASSKHLVHVGLHKWGNDYETGRVQRALENYTANT